MSGIIVFLLFNLNLKILMMKSFTYKKQQHVTFKMYFKFERTKKFKT